MLIPRSNLQGGRIVQLVQGERLALETDDVDGWIERFASSRRPAHRPRRGEERRRQRALARRSAAACRAASAAASATRDRAAAVLAGGRRKVDRRSGAVPCGEPDSRSRTRSRSVSAPTG
jgi:hypothetical protein